MESFRIRALREADIEEIITAAGGFRAHPNAERRHHPGADFCLGEAIIELKIIDDEGLAKPERQNKLAALFSEIEPVRPVVVLDRAVLSVDQQRRFDRILEGPIKSAVAKARRQLSQSRAEFPDKGSSILFVVNNGYTALDHDALTSLVAHRVRQDTNAIDGVVVAGCYFYSDEFDGFCIWPIDYVAINARDAFPSFSELEKSWGSFAELFMTRVIRGELASDSDKGAVVDTQFDVDGITYVKPAPPMGVKSKIYVHGRPRRNSSGIETCPPVALVLPELSFSEWRFVRDSVDDPFGPLATYEAWQAYRREAMDESNPTQVFMPIGVTGSSWIQWCSEKTRSKDLDSLNDYACELFNVWMRSIVKSARERTAARLVISKYVLAFTEEIGRDKANDISHIFVVRERPGGKQDIRPLVQYQRMFHEHALALASAHALAQGVEVVLWQKDTRYAWM